MQLFEMNYPNMVKFTLKYTKMNNNKDSIIYNGYRYWYEYRLAENRKDICLATKDPTKYCNGFYLYSDKDSGNGKAFVVIKTNNPDPNWMKN